MGLISSRNAAGMRTLVESLMGRKNSLKRLIENLKTEGEG
jgi:hypothetical protein